MYRLGPASAASSGLHAFLCQLRISSCLPRNFARPHYASHPRITAVAPHSVLCSALVEQWQDATSKDSVPEAQSPLDSGLYLVATPIGNLEDISLRALRILQQAELVLAEDTRHSRKLLDHFSISAAMQSLHEHNERSQQSKVFSSILTRHCYIVTEYSNMMQLNHLQILSMLSRGAAIALISDAGMPLISDPGGGLVKAAIDAGHKIIPIPGASAAVTALVASGLPASEFTFIGFLPPKQNARLKKLQSLSGDLIPTFTCFTSTALAGFKTVGLLQDQQCPCSMKNTARIG